MKLKKRIEILKKLKCFYFLHLWTDWQFLHHAQCEAKQPRQGRYCETCLKVQTRTLKGDEMVLIEYNFFTEKYRKRRLVEDWKGQKIYE